MRRRAAHEAPLPEPSPGDEALPSAGGIVPRGSHLTSVGGDRLIALVECCYEVLSGGIHDRLRCWSSFTSPSCDALSRGASGAAPHLEDLGSPSREHWTLPDGPRTRRRTSGQARRHAGGHLSPESSEVGPLEALSEGEGLAAPTYFDWNHVWEWLEGVETVRRRLERALSGDASRPQSRWARPRNTPSVDSEEGQRDDPADTPLGHGTSPDYTERGATTP
jgi:hypothetical protein